MLIKDRSIEYPQEYNWFEKNKSLIDELIVSKGAVLFKNFNLKDKEDFAKFIKEVIDLKSLS